MTKNTDAINYFAQILHVKNDKQKTYDALFQLVFDIAWTDDLEELQGILASTHHSQGTGGQEPSESQISDLAYLIHGQFDLLSNQALKRGVKSAAETISDTEKSEQLQHIATMAKAIIYMAVCLQDPQLPFKALETILIIAANNGLKGSVPMILSHANAGSISAIHLGEALSWLAEQDPKQVGAILRHPNATSIEAMHLGFALECLAEHDPKQVGAILRHPNATSIEAKHLGLALSWLAEKDPEQLGAILSLPNANDISAVRLGIALSWLAEKTHEQVRTILSHPNAKDIDAEHLGVALHWLAKNNPEQAGIILSHPNAKDIDAEDLGAVLRGVADKDPEQVGIILRHPNASDISAEDLGQSMMLAARTDHRLIAQMMEHPQRTNLSVYHTMVILITLGALPQSPYHDAVEDEPNADRKAMTEALKKHLPVLYRQIVSKKINTISSDILGQALKDAAASKVAELVYFIMALPNADRISRRDLLDSLNTLLRTKQYRPLLALLRWDNAQIIGNKNLNDIVAQLVREDPFLTFLAECREDLEYLDIEKDITLPYLYANILHGLLQLHEAAGKSVANKLFTQPDILEHYLLFTSKLSVVIAELYPALLEKIITDPFYYKLIIEPVSKSPESFISLFNCIATRAPRCIELIIDACHGNLNSQTLESVLAITKERAPFVLPSLVQKYAARFNSGVSPQTVTIILECLVKASSNTLVDFVAAHHQQFTPEHYQTLFSTADKLAPLLQTKAVAAQCTLYLGEIAKQYEKRGKDGSKNFSAMILLHPNVCTALFAPTSDHELTTNAARERELWKYVALIEMLYKQSTTVARQTEGRYQITYSAPGNKLVTVTLSTAVNLENMKATLDQLGSKKPNQKALYTRHLKGKAAYTKDHSMWEEFCRMITDTAHQSKTERPQDQVQANPVNNEEAAKKDAAQTAKTQEAAKVEAEAAEHRRRTELEQAQEQQRQQMIAAALQAIQQQEAEEAAALARQVQALQLQERRQREQDAAPQRAPIIPQQPENRGPSITFPNWMKTHQLQWKQVGKWLDVSAPKRTVDEEQRAKNSLAALHGHAEEKHIVACIKLNAITVEMGLKWEQVQAWLQRNSKSAEDFLTQYTKMKDAEKHTWATQIKYPPKQMNKPQQPLFRLLSLDKALLDQPLYDEAMKAYLALSGVVKDQCSSLNADLINLYCLYQMLRLFRSLSLLAKSLNDDMMQLAIGEGDAKSIANAIRHRPPEQLLDAALGIHAFAERICQLWEPYFVGETRGPYFVGKTRYKPTSQLDVPVIFSGFSAASQAVKYDHATAERLLRIKDQALKQASASPTPNASALIDPKNVIYADIVAMALSLLRPMFVEVPLCYANLCRDLGHRFTQETYVLNGKRMIDPQQVADSSFEVPRYKMADLISSLEFVTIKPIGKGKHPVNYVNENVSPQHIGSSWVSAVAGSAAMAGSATKNLGG